MKITGYLKIVFCFSVYCFPLVSIADNASPSEVACRYETKVMPHDKKKTPANHEAWFFWRRANMIQTQDADGDHGEIWELMSNGTIQYRKLYHEDRTAVEYMPADQPTHNLNQDWFKLSSMLSQQELNDLKWVRKTKALGRNAELRKGEKDGKSVEVVWLVDEQLPASIVMKDQSGSVELHLAAISPLTDASWKPVPTEDIANYRHIDAVDFGDMENDPFVKKLMSKVGHHHH